MSSGMFVTTAHNSSSLLPTLHFLSTSRVPDLTAFITTYRLSTFFRWKHLLYSQFLHTPLSICCWHNSMSKAQGSARNILSSIKRQSSVYEKLPNQDVYDGEQPASSPQILWGKKDPSQFRTMVLRITLIFVIILAAFLLVTGLILAFKPNPKDSDQEFIPCGHTPTEARAAGCRFEPMMSAWIPEKCLFPELIDDNTGTFENWLFFSDEKTTQPITGAELDGVRVGNYTKVFSTHGTAHDLHCLYAWRKLNLAVERGAKLIDSKSRSLHHTTHCAKHIAQLLEEGAGYLPKDDDIRHITAFPLLFLSCVPLESK
ncbi:hypothetical protein F4823DRAFT_581292 [Ustulina deusta]|nr:hypothetical protein F4823DRAFT_581292 [Ustulina deusta]